MRKLFLLLFVLGFSANLWNTPPKAHACTGYKYSIRRHLEHADIVVKAEVVEAGTRGQNAVLRVENYLYGDGPEYIVFTQHYPEDVQYLESPIFVSGYCGGIKAPLEIGDHFYAILNHQKWGNYVVFNLDIINYFEFPTPETTLDLAIDEYWEDDAIRPTYINDELNEAEFVALINQYTGEIPHPPQPNNVYPQTGLLKITTEQGTSYVLPLDESSVAEFSELDVFVIDGIWQSARNGAIVFPVAFIRNNYLKINRPLPAGDYETIIYVELQDFDLLKSPLYVWSNNRQLLAYSDGAGLWLVNLFGETTTPQLIYPSSNGIIPYARHFSPQNRYLAIEMGERVFNLDLLTNEEFPDGLFAPNETLLLTYESNRDLSPSQICLPYQCRDTGLQIKDAIWKDSTWYFAVVCEDEDCFVEELHNQWSLGRNSRRVVIGKGYALAYEPYSETLAIVSDRSTITIDNQVYDLTSQLDSDIVSVEWLASLLYWEQ